MRPSSGNTTRSADSARASRSARGATRGCSTPPRLQSRARSPSTTGRANRARSRRAPRRDRPRSRRLGCHALSPKLLDDDGQHASHSRGACPRRYHDVVHPALACKTPPATYRRGSRCLSVPSRPSRGTPDPRHDVVRVAHVPLAGPLMPRGAGGLPRTPLPGHAARSRLRLVAMRAQIIAQPPLPPPLRTRGARLPHSPGLGCSGTGGPRLLEGVRHGAGGRSGAGISACIEEEPEA